MKNSLILDVKGLQLHLAIETGRFRGLKPEEHICVIWKTGSVEDFLCACSNYNAIRNFMYERVSEEYPDFNILNNEEKFMTVFVEEWMERSV